MRQYGQQNGYQTGGGQYYRPGGNLPHRGSNRSAAGSLHSSVHTSATRPPPRTNRVPGSNVSGLTPQYFELGTIFRASTHDVLLNPNIQVGDPSRTESTFGAICSKKRPWIVIGLTDTTVVAVAMFTHQGRGGDKQVPEEIVGIRRSDNQSYVKPVGNPYRSLVMDHVGDWFNASSVVHLTQIRTFDLKQKLDPDGCLTAESADQLADLYNQRIQHAIGKAMHGRPSTLLDPGKAPKATDMYSVLEQEDESEEEEGEIRTPRGPPPETSTASSHIRSSMSFASAAGSATPSQQAGAVCPGGRAMSMAMPRR